MGFYNAFDLETQGSRKPDEFRSVFEVDRDRLLHTPAFRRLQAKTQVFMAGEFDFYRTRLTHSLEVAQIGRGIARFLARSGSPECEVDGDLIEAVCLAHDLGHPPFGHAGERALNDLMAPYGGFEGNAQTLRLLTDIIYKGREGRRGMDPSRAFLDGVLKYKALWSDLPPEKRGHHFLYDDQRDHLAFAHPGMPTSPPFQFQSIECQIMDWADDTAYSLNDLADGVRARFLTADRIRQFADADASGDELARRWADAFVNAVRDDRVDAWVGKKTGSFLRACRAEPCENAMSPLSARYRWTLRVEEDIRREAEWYKHMATQVVFRSPQLQHLEYKSRHLLEKMFGVFLEQHVLGDGTRRGLNLLSPGASRSVASAATIPAKARIVCDYLAGMTDAFAIRTYKRLFDPDFGSLTDLE